jgi:regulatory protein
VPAKSRSTDKSGEASDRLKRSDDFARICRFCAYQERSHHEVRTKLESFGLGGDAVDELLARLITDGFVNEERFAKAFAGGKFRMKHWGRLKIERALKAHDISSRCIAIGLREIDNDDYRASLEIIITKKSDALTDDNLLRKRDTISKYAIGKGFEPDLVWEALRELLPGN